MRLEIFTTPETTLPVEPVVVAAIAAVIAAATEAASDGADTAAARRSPWRAAARGLEAFDAYDSARRDRMVRLGNAR